MIRKATHDDYRRLIAMVRYQDQSYINKAMLKEDLTNNAITLIEEGGKIKAVCSLVFDYTYKMFYLKRLFVSKQARGKGFGRMMIKHMMEETGGNLACTPFGTNEIMIKLIEELGFEYQYTFLKDFHLYLYK